MSMAANSVTATDGSGLVAFNGTFYYDALGLMVSTTNPAPGGAFSIPAGSFTFDVTFNEAITPSSVSTSDLILSQGSVNSVTVLPGNTTARFTLAGFASEGSVNISMPANAVIDSYGNPGSAAFSATYQIDAVSTAFPTPLESVAPLGSLVYDPTIDGLINFVGDTDAFTLTLDANQRATIEVLPIGSSLRPSVTLVDPSNITLGSATASAAGQNAWLQSMTVSSAGTYKIVVGSAASTTGGYTVRVVLNAALERESLDGTTNNTRATAQAINGSFINLATGVNSGSRGAVLGNFVGNDDFFSFSANAGDSLTLGMVALQSNAGNNFHVQLQNSAGTVLATGVAAGNLTGVIDRFVVASSGTYYARITGTGLSDYNLVLTRQATFDIESNNEAATAQILSGTTGVLGHVVGGSTGTLFDVSGTTVSGPLVLTGNQIQLGIATDGSFITNNLSTGIRFNGTEFVVPGTPVASFTVSYNGTNYTNNVANGVSQITVTSIQDVSSGNLRGVKITGTAGSALRVERVVLFNVDDDFVTIGTRLTNLGSTTVNNVATLENVDPDQDFDTFGDYQTSNDVVLGGHLVWAKGPTSGLTIGLGSANPGNVVSSEGFDNRNPFDIINSPVDPNGATSDIAICQAFNMGSLSAGAQVSGIAVMVFGSSSTAAETVYTDNSNGIGLSDWDWFSFTLSAGQTVLNLETATPADGAGEFVNDLNPQIEVYDASGTTLIAAGTVLADGRNEQVHMSGLVPGTTYKIKVMAEAMTGGEYYLGVKATSSGVYDSGILTNVTDVWQTVTLSQTFADPIVIVGPMQVGDASPGTVRIRNVTGNSFQIQVNEWDYLDGTHGAETVSYLVLNRGVTTLDNGKVFVADSASVTGSFSTVNFSSSFGSTPVVLATVASDNDPQAVTARLQNITQGGFSVRVQEEEANDGSHPAETVNYIAALPGLGNSNGLVYEVGLATDITHKAFVTPFNQTFLATPRLLASMQTYNSSDTANVRLKGLNAKRVSPFIEEERSLDNEISHVGETVGFMAFRVTGSPSGRLSVETNLIDDAGPTFTVPALAVTDRRSVISDLSGTPSAAVLPESSTSNIQSAESAAATVVQADQIGVARAGANSVGSIASGTTSTADAWTLSTSQESDRIGFQWYW